jgi:tripartite-type tricarboxylate transporter receptor subunit TctC
MSSAYGFFASTKYRSFEDVLAAAKAKPGVEFNFASAGAFNTLAMAMLKAQTGINYVAVTYKGGVPIAQALSVNEVDFTLGATASFIPMMKAGKIRLLFLTRKSASLPEVPDAAQLGLQNFTPGTNISVWAPAATPSAVVNRLSSEFAAATRQKPMQEKIHAAFDTDPVGSSAEEMRRIVEADLRFWTEAARIANFTPE